MNHEEIQAQLEAIENTDISKDTMKEFMGKISNSGSIQDQIAAIDRAIAYMFCDGEEDAV